MNIKYRNRNLRQNNLNVIRVPEEGKEFNSKKRNISRNNGLTLLEFAKRHKQEIQEAGWIPNGINAKESMTNHIITKLLKTIEIQNYHKEKILKATRDKLHVTYKEATIWMNAGFSSETMQARKKGITCFKVCKEFYYLVKISFRNKNNGKVFSA